MDRTVHRHPVALQSMDARPMTTRTHHHAPHSGAAGATGPPAAPRGAPPTPATGAGAVPVHRHVNWEAASVVVGLLGAWLLYKHSSSGVSGGTIIQGAASSPIMPGPSSSSNIGLPIAGNPVATANPISGPTAGGNWWDTLYQSVDHRAQNADGSYGDAGGQQFWSAETATVGQAQATKEFLATPEAAIQQDYASSLGRSADAGGLSFYVNEIQTGAMNNAQVAASIANSQEAKNRVAAAGHV